MIFLAGADCIGTEMIGNTLYGGNGSLVAGEAEPAVVENNKAFPLGDAARPVPKVPSIYKWQHKQ
jgi:hypothetical protein